jgi:hypothetical protein
MRLVVVDNASPDETREILARKAGFANVILGEGNIGFGRGCNRGLHEADTPYTIFINPDAELEPEALRTLAEFLEAHPRCGVCGPAVCDDDGKTQHAGGLATPWTFIGDALGRYISMRSRTSVSPGQAPFSTTWVSGAMLCGRTSVLKSIGGFHPRFFLYFEETDLCRRTLRAGHEIWCVPTAKVVHIGGVSAAEETSERVRGCIPVHYYQSRQFYIRRHFGLLAAIATDAVELVMMPLHAAARKILGRKATPIFQRWRHSVWMLPKQVTPEAFEAMHRFLP